MMHQASNSSSAQQCARGIALLDALIASALTIAGLLAFSTWQLTLRHNATSSHMQAHALSLAQHTLNTIRSEIGELLVTVADEARPHEFALLVEEAGTRDESFDAMGITFNVVVRTTTSTSMRLADVDVVVSWSNAQQQQQLVSLHTAMTLADPRLSGALALRSAAP